jgi:hypothetical protein
VGAGQVRSDEHLNVVGTYRFTLPGRAGGGGPRHDPDADDETVG